MYIHDIVWCTGLSLYVMHDCHDCYIHDYTWTSINKHQPMANQPQNKWNKCLCHSISLNCVCRYLVTTLMGIDCVFNMGSCCLTFQGILHLDLNVHVCSHFETKTNLKSLRSTFPSWSYLAMQPFGTTSLVLPAIPRPVPLGRPSAAPVPVPSLSTALPCAAVCGCWWGRHGLGGFLRPASQKDTW